MPVHLVDCPSLVVCLPVCDCVSVGPPARSRSSHTKECRKCLFCPQLPPPMFSVSRSWKKRITFVPLGIRINGCIEPSSDKDCPANFPYASRLRHNSYSNMQSKMNMRRIGTFTIVSTSKGCKVRWPKLMPILKGVRGRYRPCEVSAREGEERFHPKKTSAKR